MKTTNITDCFWGVLLISCCSPSGLLFGFDNNNNRIPDGLEYIYFSGFVSGYGDSDDDAYSDLEEILWGSDPRSQSSIPGQLMANIRGSDMVISWSGSQGRSYIVEGGEILGQWNVITEGRFTEFTRAMSSVDHRFYRVRSIPDVDSNGDGISDSEEHIWLERFGGKPNSTDIDSDGLTDFEELRAGRNPKKKDHPKVDLELFNVFAKTSP